MDSSNLLEEKMEKKYEQWTRQRDTKEAGLYCLVKLVCDSCGHRWTENVKLSLPPCPVCGSENVYEYDTILVG